MAALESGQFRGGWVDRPKGGYFYLKKVERTPSPIAPVKLIGAPPNVEKAVDITEEKTTKKKGEEDVVPEREKEAQSLRDSVPAAVPVHVPTAVAV